MPEPQIQLKSKVMVDISKHIGHWRAGAREDWEVAQDLLRRGRTRHGLFFAHLAVEKALKAQVCQKTNQLAPPIHNLVRLADLAGLSLSDERRELLAEVNSFNIEGRYPELFFPLPSRHEVESYLKRIEDLLTCLHQTS
ncbi:HEPN domain-containing protein [Geoalkalibacter halelectricus]|uniref:HEPN domain-containing protein n=1 Tax=Geoalkalibacter halelectricus TaxID=2847045 RepID=UPI003D24A233